MPEFLKAIVQAAAKVTTPITLLAFIVAAIVVVYYVWSKAKGRDPRFPRLTVVSFIVLALIGASFSLANRYIGGQQTAVYRIRALLVTPEGIPVDDAKLWSTVGGESKRVPGGYEIDVPKASIPADRKVTLLAEHEASFLAGKTEILLASDLNPVVLLRLGHKPF